MGETVKWGDTHLMLRTPDGEWQDLGEIKVIPNPTLEPIEKNARTYEVSPVEGFTIRFHGTWRCNMSRLRFFQFCGVKKAPRCTYKTNMDYINRRRYNGHKKPKK